MHRDGMSRRGIGFVYMKSVPDTRAAFSSGVSSAISFSTFTGKTLLPFFWYQNTVFFGICLAESYGFLYNGKQKGGCL